MSAQPIDQSTGSPNTPAALPPLKRHELQIDLTENDRPEDRFSTHVNNARYFAFINQTFQGWYRLMGLRGKLPDQSAVMAHVSYDFLRQVQVPGTVLCRINTVRAGSTSLEHEVQIWDLRTPAAQLAGRGKVIHVFMRRSSATPLPWPAELLALCWHGEPCHMNSDTLEPWAAADRPNL